MAETRDDSGDGSAGKGLLANLSKLRIPGFGTPKHPASLLANELRSQEAARQEAFRNEQAARPEEERHLRELLGGITENFPREVALAWLDNPVFEPMDFGQENTGYTPGDTLKVQGVRPESEGGVFLVEELNAAIHERVFKAGSIAETGVRQNIERSVPRLNDGGFFTEPLVFYRRPIVKEAQGPNDYLYFIRPEFFAPGAGDLMTAAVKTPKGEQVPGVVTDNWNKKGIRTSNVGFVDESTIKGFIDSLRGKNPLRLQDGATKR